MEKNLRNRIGILQWILMIAIIAAAVILPCSRALAATGVDVETHTQDEIRAYLQDSGGVVNRVSAYDTQPGIIGPDYFAGALTDATQQNALDVLNGVRYIAGVPYQVTLDSTYISQVQAGALVNYVNNQLSHTPAKPSDMSDTLYNLGYEGTSSSNIAWSSVSDGVALGESIVYGWMADEDSSNIDRVGHRRWCLNPSMQRTGFGSVWGTNGCYSAMYSFNRTGSSSITTVPWPAQNMPTEYFASDYPWSISRSTAFAAGTTVKLTRLGDNKVWNFSTAGETADGYFNINNAGYGMYGCVIFRPSGVENYSAGDVYQVEVTENGQKVIDYTVTFFDLKATLTGITATKTKTAYTVGDKFDISDLTVTASYSDGSTKKVTGYTTNASALDINTAGTKTLTVTYEENGVTVKTTVTIQVAEKQDPVIECKHTHTSVAGQKAATCTQTGYTGDTVCKDCGEVIKKGSAVAKKAHTYGNKKTVVKATTKKNGSITKTCTVCGAKAKTTIYAPKKVSLSKTSYVYDGKAKKPTVTVTDKKGKKISKASYTVSYSANKNAGQAKVTVKFKGNYSGSMVKTFEIQPKKTELSRLTAKSKGFVVKWKKQNTQISGYELQCSISSKFTKKTTETERIAKGKAAEKKITKLRANRKYYVRIRTYKTVKVNGKSVRVYSQWSKAKTVVTKK